MMKAKRGSTFDNFFVYDGNRVAYLAGQKIIQFPGELFNPFYVYSGTGMGKTHLLWAIHAELNKSSTVLFFTGKEFEKYLDETREYANSLVVDDLHVVSDKYHETILEIIDRAVVDNKQMCFAGNAAPREVKNFSAKLASRLEGGLSCDIQPPKEMFLVEMIKKKSEESGIILPDDIALELAQISTGSIRTIEGMINRLVAYSSLGQMSLDLSTIRLILKEFYPRGIYSPVSSLLEELKKNATDVLQDVAEQADPRDEYKEKIYIWEMKGFDTSTLKPLVNGDIEVLVREYDNFIKKVETLVELQKEFGTLDVRRAPDEAMKIETMFFSPDKIPEIKMLLQKIKAKNRPAFKTFEDFFVGDCNRNAVEIYRNSILPNLGKQFNPFVIIGQKGTGKTHFLQAVWSDLVAQGKCPVFSDLDQPVNLNNEETAAGDVVIIDNFSGIFKRTSAERKNWFDLISNLVKKDIEVILSTDSFPGELAIASDEKTAFELGIEVKLDPPSPDVFIPYIRKHAPPQLSESMIKGELPMPASFYEIDGFIKDFNLPVAAVAQVETAAPAAEILSDIVSFGLPGDAEPALEPKIAEPVATAPEPETVDVETSKTAAPADVTDDSRSPADDIFSLEADRQKDDAAVETLPVEEPLTPAEPVTPAATTVSEGSGNVDEPVKRLEKSFKPLKEERLIFPEIIGELVEENF
jgi:chromosomal replication initiation ATPase DnaA